MSVNATAATITLAGQPYTIQPLTIGQQRDLQIGVTIPPSDDPQENVRRAFDRNLAVILAALSDGYPQITRDALLQMRGSTPQERVAAVNAILEFAGLVARTETPPGEAAAGA
jgi:hypothetical protein